MPQLRLFGLVLFITTVFLAMAAATTQTTHIRFKKPSRDDRGVNPSERQAVSSLFADEPVVEDSTENRNSAGSSRPLQFIAIPVVYPLAVSAGIGLLMWFVPAPLTAQKSASKRRSRRRK